MHISLSSANYGLQILTFVCSSIAMTLGNQPTNLAMLQSASAPVYDNPTRVDIVVFPTKSWDPKAIEMIDQTIRKTVTIGHYQKHQGLYLPQFSNVLSWTIYSASTGEHQELVKQLSDIADVHLNEIFAGGDEVEDIGISATVSSRLYNATVPLNLKPNAIEYQRGAYPDLKVVSWPPATSFDQLISYAFDKSGGKQTYFYVIDQGIDAANKEFPRTAETQWLYAPDIVYRHEDTPTDSDPKSHGSCVASKAQGVVNGIAKNINLISVKALNSVGDVPWAFNAILESVKEHHRQKKAVILWAATSTAKFPNEKSQPWASIKPLMQMLFAEDVTIVVPAGNYGNEQGRSKVDTLPATWESNEFPLVVAGAVDNLFDKGSFSQGPERVTVHAPGVEVRCAKKGQGAAGQSTGTSVASGMVAGLVAYYLGLSPSPSDGGLVSTATKMRSMLAGQAWSRLGESKSPRVIWNGLDGTGSGKRYF